MQSEYSFGEPLREGSLLSLPSRKKESLALPKKRVIVISGPTASGKSRLAIELAQLMGGEIISADSVQVYRGLDIGTAKVSRGIRSRIPHHLIDICDLSESFNVVKFYQLAVEAIFDCLQRGHVPIVVGGTGFYLRALLLGPPSGPPADPELRKKILSDIEKFGVEALHDKVERCDPEYAKTINRSDRHKVVRALEVMTLTGRKLSDFSDHKGDAKANWDFRCWFVYFPRSILFPRIEMRCDEMLSKGLISEVEDLVSKGLESNSSASQAVGYRQCLDFLSSPRSHADWENFVWVFKKATRHYAKRQFTWFRKEPTFQWVDLEVYGYQKVLEWILRDYESFY